MQKQAEKFEKNVFDNKVESLFRSDSTGSFHDAVHEAIGKSYSDNTLKKLFYVLPENIQNHAFDYGLSDTVFRDNVYVFLQQKDLNNENIN